MKSSKLTTLRSRACRAACSLLLGLTAAASNAGVLINENAEWPLVPFLEAFPRTDANIEAERDARFNRNLAQTFQLAAPIKLDKIYIDYEEGVIGKEFTVRIFTVASVNAGTLIQPETAGFAGTVHLSILCATTPSINELDGGNNVLAALELDLTGADEVTLPATSGTAGYALQIVRTGEGSGDDLGAERVFKWHFNDGDNRYAGGRAYAVNGGGVDGADDFLFALAEIVLDADSDGMPDGYEEANGFDKNLAADAGQDADNDGLANLQEFQKKTLPRNPDTDNDGLADGKETNTGAYLDANNTGTDPLNRDTDGDGVKDGAETYSGTFVNADNTGTDPHLADTDGDRYVDGTEVMLGSSPVDSSSVPSSTGLNLLAFWNFDSGEGTSSLDQVHNFVAELRNGAVYSAEGAGRSGQGTDRSVDFGATAVAGRGVFSGNAQWLNAAGVADKITVSYWQKWNANIANSSAFWFASPTAASANAGRGRGAHAETPWGDGNIPWDTAGATVGTSRIIKNISGFTEEAPNAFFSRWHHFAFVKDGPNKAVYIDGKLFNSGENFLELPTDFNEIWLGVEPDGTDNMRGMMDDFAVFGAALTQSQIGALAAGFAPNNLDNASADTDGDGLPNYWEEKYSFNKDLAADAAQDADNDGLSNLSEFQLTTDPRDDDSDNDGSLDGVEVTKGTDPLKRDTDGDGLNDGAETGTGTFVNATNTGTDPLQPDTDFDGYSDGTEVAVGTSPLSNTSIPGLGAGDKLFAYWNFNDASDTAKTLDKIHGFTGNIVNGPVFTADAGGRTGKAGDRGMDFGNASVTGRAVRSTDIAPYLQVAAASDTFTLSWWQKWNGPIANSSAVWWVSPRITTGGSRGLNSHMPYGNSTVYFDSGIADGNNYVRISGNPMTTFDPTLNWQQWHHIALVKGPDAKEIWIDGQMFLTGGGGPLPTDLTELILGMDFSNQGNTARIVMDDFAIYGTSLDSAKIALLAQGASPETFDFPPTPFRVTQVAYASGSLSLSWESEPGKTYQIWRSTSLPGGWASVGTISASGATSSFTDASAPGQAAFYRISLQP